MPPQPNQSYRRHDQMPPSGEVSLDADPNELQRKLTQEAFDAYADSSTDNDAESRRDIGAAAMNRNDLQPAMEQAVNYEKIELTLEQLGRNIELMRKDATNKTVNPYPKLEGLVAAKVSSGQYFHRQTAQSRDNTGYQDNFELAA